MDSLRLFRTSSSLDYSPILGAICLWACFLKLRKQFNTGFSPSQQQQQLTSLRLQATRTPLLKVVETSSKISMSVVSALHFQKGGYDTDFFSREQASTYDVFIACFTLLGKDLNINNKNWIKVHSWEGGQQKLFFKQKVKCFLKKKVNAFAFQS